MLANFTEKNDAAGFSKVFLELKKNPTELSRTLLTTDTQGNTLLHLVARKNNLLMARLLLSSDIDFYATNAAGLTPLEVAKANQAADVTALLSMRVGM